MRSTGPLALVCLALFCRCCVSFGNDGHRVIAEIASHLIKPSSAKLLDVYFDGMPLSDVCVIPDEYNHHPAGAWTYAYHFVDYTRNDETFQWANCPNPRGCAISAIFNYTKIQSADTLPYVCRAASNSSFLIEPCALIFLSHFVGDIHQPLHCAYKDDRGGNFVKVNFFGVSMTLHKVWDTALIKHHFNVTNSDWQSFATDLLTGLSSADRKAYAGETDPIMWSNESFNITRDDAYNFGGDDLGINYYKENFPRVATRMLQGGVRLAALLDYVLQNSQQELQNSLRN